MKTFSKLSLIFIMFIIIPSSHSLKTVYIDGTDGDNKNNGLTASTAVKDLETALSKDPAKTKSAAARRFLAV
jgi:hypothetical protein